MKADNGQYLSTQDAAVETRETHLSVSAARGATSAGTASPQTKQMPVYDEPEERQMGRNIKIKKRTVLILIAIAVLVWIVAGGILSSSQADDAAGYVMPGNVTRDFSGTDVWKYYLYFYENKFQGYPWVVKISYSIFVVALIFCLCTGIYMLRFFYRQERNKSIQREFAEKYEDKVEQIVAGPAEMSTAQIAGMIDLKGRKLNDTEVQVWILQIIHIAMRHKGYTMQVNIQRLIAYIGAEQYMLRTLDNGKRGCKIRVVQAIRLLHLQVPYSIMARLINDRTLPLRNVARLYHALTSHDDPYMFLNADYLNSNFVRWDSLEFDNLLNECKAQGKDMPSFLPIIYSVKTDKVQAMLIEMVGKYGTEEECRALFDFFDSDNELIRRAAYRAMGIHRFLPAEKVMMAHFPTEHEVVRRTILHAISKIHSGQAEGFLKKVYGMTASYHTRRTILKVLRHYSDLGMQYFYELQAKATPREMPIFWHVEDPIINREV